MKSTRLNVINNFLKEREVNSYTALFYSILWRFALIGSFASYLATYAPGKEAKWWTILEKLYIDFDWGQFWTVLFVLFTVIQLWTVYVNVHQIEKKQAGPLRDYRSWLGRPMEKGFRFFIVLFLLFGVGKIAPAVGHLVHQIPILNSWRMIQRIENSDTNFVVSSAFAFSFVTVWNIGALFSNDPATRKDRNSAKSRNIDKKGSIAPIVKFRILMYILVSLLAAIYWWTKYFKVESALNLVPAYIILFGILIVARNDFMIAQFIPVRILGKPNPKKLPVVDLQRKFSQDEQNVWRKQIHDIYDQMRNLTFTYTVQYNNMSIYVVPNVYAPCFFTDSQWFATIMPRIVKKSSLLEIGCGTGIIALSCAKRGARVVATDINPDAVRNAQMNVANLHLNVAIREGDVYEPIQPSEKFDFIFWAHPFNNWDSPVTDMLLRSGMDYGYNDLRAYISGARDHLTEKGRLLLGTGDSADLSTINIIAQQNGYSIRTLYYSDMPLEVGGDVQIRYLLFEFSDKESQL